MAKEEISVLGCPFRKDGISELPLIYGINLMKVPSPVAIGEIAGNYPSRFEHTLSSIHRIINKMSFFYIHTYIYLSSEQVNQIMITIMPELRLRSIASHLR